MTKRACLFAFIIACIWIVSWLICAWAQEDQKPQSICVTCHTHSTPVIVTQWRESKHGRMGLDCKACHAAQEGNPGAKKHYDGSFITPVVGPKICGQCHASQEKEFSASRHAAGAEFIGSLDNVIGEIVEGGPAAILGCRQCHGSVLSVDKSGTLDAATWPNYGIGRVNLDGSKGTCVACHNRHAFSVSQAREPETCAKCHMGPDHPQKEVYEESKHGIQFRANKDKMNMSARPWVVGKDYNAAPTCATCHMSAYGDQPVTHDVGARISWTLRPAVSVKLENWQSRRESMQAVCRQCHGQNYVSNFYKQFDSAVELYNEKFAKPAKDAMDKLLAEKLITETPFDEKIEWTYYLMWHHDGRSARHGAAMMGPDYVQWHGFFPLAQRFYTEFIPQVRTLKPEIAERILTTDEHKWVKGLTPAVTDELSKFYKDKYGQR